MTKVGQTFSLTSLHGITLINSILVSIEADKPDEEDLDLAARCVDLINKSSPEDHFKMLSTVRAEFGTTGVEQKAKLLPAVFSQFCDIGTTMNKNGDAKLW